MHYAQYREAMWDLALRQIIDKARQLTAEEKVDKPTEAALKAGKARLSGFLRLDADDEFQSNSRCQICLAA